MIPQMEQAGAAGTRLRSPENDPRGAPDLTGSTTPSGADSPAIKLVARRAGGRTYVFAVNSLRQHVRAQLHVPALRPGRASVFAERRSVPVGHDRLNDDFAPLAVHLYVQ